MKKKHLIGSLILVCVLLVGFQVAQDLGLHLLQSPGAVVKDYVEPDYGLGSGHIDSLKPFPEIQKGERTPFDLWNYGGKGKSSFMDPNLPMEWNEWLAFHNKQKPQLMKDIVAYMNSRYDFNGEIYTQLETEAPKKVKITIHTDLAYNETIVKLRHGSLL